jgi:hypothetical protein
MAHTSESVVEPVARLRALREEYGRQGRFEVVVGGAVASPSDVDRWTGAGVDRLIVSPWARSSQAVEGLRSLAALTSTVAGR